jgi:hypothetical protein
MLDRGHHRSAARRRPQLTMDTHQAAASFTGLVATATGLTVSLLPEIEAWLRIASLLVGIAVGVASLYAILNKKRPPLDP